MHLLIEGSRAKDEPKRDADDDHVTRTYFSRCGGRTCNDVADDDEEEPRSTVLPRERPAQNAIE